MIVFCPHCIKKLTVPDSMVGQQVQCAACKHAFTVEGEQTSPPVAPQAASGPGFARSLLGRLIGPRAMAALGKIIVLGGLTLVVFARGCDSVGQRGVDRAQAKLEQAKNEFEDDWQDRIRRAEKAEPKDNELLKKLNEDRKKEKEEMDTGQLLELSREARDVEIENRMDAYWLEWLFVFASIVLVVGLMLVGFYGSRAERIACLVVLAIIAYSIYVGGIAWINPAGAVMRAIRGGT